MKPQRYEEVRGSYSDTPDPRDIRGMKSETRVGYVYPGHIFDTRNEHRSLKVTYED